MTRQTMKLGVLGLCVVLSFLSSCARVAAKSNSSEQIIEDINGQLIRYGPNNTFDIKLHNESTLFMYGFYFGQGDPGAIVRTDTVVSLGVSSPSSLLLCQNGTAVRGFQGASPPSDGLFVVRYNVSFDFYYLHLSDSPMGIQFNTSANPLFLCTPNVTSTPIQFLYDFKPSTPPSSSHSFFPSLPLLSFIIPLCLLLSSPFSF